MSFLEIKSSIINIIALIILKIIYKYYLDVLGASKAKSSNLILMPALSISQKVKSQHFNKISDNW